MSSSSTERLTEKIKQLVLIYNRSKECFVLLEDILGKTYIAPVNEYRNALDHIIRFFDDAEKSNIEEDDVQSLLSEIDSAESHILRSGFDSLDLLCTELIERIESAFTKYPPEDVATVYPDYYIHISSNIRTLRNQVACNRAFKQEIDPETNRKSFNEMYENTYSLYETYKDVNKYIPGIEEFVKNKATDAKKRERRSTIKTIIISVVVSAFFFLLGLLVAKTSNP